MTMYKSDFVAVIKCNGKIMRENKESVFLPFGQEYCIFMKNLRAQRALVSISIDGQDVLNGNKLIINGNSELELERFLDNINEGSRFKFIQKTQKIQEYRGDKIDDGIIRIEFQYEQQYNYKPYYYDPYWYTHTTFPNYTTCGGTTPLTLSSTNIVCNLNCDMIDGHHASDFINCSNDIRIKSSGDSIISGVLRGSNSTSTCSTASSNFSVGSIPTCSYDANISSNKPTLGDLSLPLQDEGITVKGSVSDQKFAKGYIGSLESEKHVITLQIKGFSDDGIMIEKPLTIQDKKICPTCGTKNKSNNKFCVECGTNLN